MTVRWIVIAAFCGTLAAALTWWWQGTSDVASEPDAAQPDLPPARAPAHSRVDAPPHILDANDFRDRVRTFVREAPQLDAAQRDARAQALRAEILAREGEGLLLPAESAYLQLALLRATVPDEAALRRRSQALLDDYQAKSEAGWAEYREAPDIRHQAYRAAEAELVQRATGDGPDALTPEELRRRLQALREQYYGDEPRP